MMGRKVLALSPILALIGVWFGVAMGGTHIVDRKLELTSGRTTIGFYSDTLAADKIKVNWKSTAEGDPNRREPTHGFEIDASNLKFMLSGTQVGHFNGSITHKGGFELVRGPHAVNIDKFSIDLTGTAGNNLELVADSPKGSFIAFNLRHSGASYDPAGKLLSIGNLDMIVTDRCAKELGEPELAGKLVGFLKVFGDCDTIDGLGDVASVQPRYSPPTGVDLELADMGGISGVARSGSYPNGITAFTCYTTSCNPGAANVNWNPPMATTHPGIIINLYRVLNGRFEQIAVSWVKHGFLATNQSGVCGTCHDNAGYYLGLGCADTYAGGNNDDQYYIGGRDEWNPTTGIWTCQNSWFSNYVNDCNRRNSGSGLGATDHLPVARDADLGNSGATYYYEARYITQGDINNYNNLASRSCSMNWTGSQWAFSTTDSSELMGPAINRYGDMHDTAIPRSEGDVIVAVKATNLGNGLYHYEYAVYNHDLDRQVSQFSVPLPMGSSVQNLDFRDIDQDGTNQWTTNLAGGQMTWSTANNPLKYGSVFNFRFDSDLPPVAATATLTQFKSGTNGPLTVNTEAPMSLGPFDSFGLVNSIQTGGNLGSLSTRDGDKLKIGIGLLPTSLSPFGVSVTGTAPSATISSLTVGVAESDNGSNATQTIALWNWNTSSWEQVDSRSATSSDSFSTVTVSSNASRFVNPTTHAIKAQVMHSMVIAPTARTVAFDQIAFHAQ